MAHEGGHRQNCLGTSLFSSVISPLGFLPNKIRAASLLVAPFPRLGQVLIEGNKAVLVRIQALELLTALFWSYHHL